MKLTLEDHLNDFRNAIGDDTYSEANLIRYLNRAQESLTRKLSVQIPIKRTMSTIAYQEEYTIPSILRHISHVRVEGDTLDSVSKGGIERIGETTRDINGTVNYYWRDGNKLGLYYTPDASAETTALNTAITSATATSFIADYTASLPSRGAVLLTKASDDSTEVMYYTNTSHSGTSTTTFSGLSRGQEGSKANTFAIDDVVTWRDIEIFGYGYPAQFINSPGSGTVTSSDSGGSVDDGVHIYKMTCYSTSLGIESTPYLVGSVTTSGGDASTVTLANLSVSTNVNIDYKRIYRTKAGKALYYYVKEIANTVESTVDIDTDATIEANDRLVLPSSSLPEERHELLTWIALERYFSDIEEMTRAMYYKNLILGEYPDAVWEEYLKRIPSSNYSVRPLPT